jgi:hypothetical protein
MPTWKNLTFLSFMFVGASCAPDVADVAVEERQAALGVDPSSAAPQRFYTLTPDLRMCMWPFCGGVWATFANHPKTPCPAGDWQEACYAASVDAAAMSDGGAAKLAGHVPGAIVLGAFEERMSDMKTSFTVLAVSRAWLPAAEESAAGVVYLLSHRDGAIYARALNGRDEDRFDQVDLTATGLPCGVVTKAQEALDQGGLVATGSGQFAWNHTSWFVAKQLYLPAHGETVSLLDPTNARDLTPAWW